MNKHGLPEAQLAHSPECRSAALDYGLIILILLLGKAQALMGRFIEQQ